MHSDYCSSFWLCNDKDRLSCHWIQSHERTHCSIGRELRFRSLGISKYWELLIPLNCYSASSDVVSLLHELPSILWVLSEHQLSHYNCSTSRTLWVWVNVDYCLSLVATCQYLVSLANILFIGSKKKIYNDQLSHLLLDDHCSLDFWIDGSLIQQHCYTKDIIYILTFSQTLAFHFWLTFILVKVLDKILSSITNYFFHKVSLSNRSVGS